MRKLKETLNSFFKKTAAEIKKQYGTKSDMSHLEFCTSGAAMINGLKFSFVIDNVGSSTDQGLCVSLSGDAVASGSFTASSQIELDCFINGKQTKLTKKLTAIEKNDGKKILQAKFKGLHLESGVTKEKDEEQAFDHKMRSQLKFSFVPCYTLPEDAEIMLTVYPYDNILEGAASKWIYACSDASSLTKYL